MRYRPRLLRSWTRCVDAARFNGLFCHRRIHNYISDWRYFDAILIDAKRISDLHHKKIKR